MELKLNVIFGNSIQIFAYCCFCFCRSPFFHILSHYCSTSFDCTHNLLSSICAKQFWFFLWNTCSSSSIFSALFQYFIQLNESTRYNEPFFVLFCDQLCDNRLFPGRLCGTGHVGVKVWPCIATYSWVLQSVYNMWWVGKDIHTCFIALVAFLFIRPGKADI